MSRSLTNGGLLEAACPKRRYRYQLLDPTDEPHATIRFYYRSYEFLQDEGIIGSSSRQCSTPSSMSTNDSWCIQSASPQGCLTIPTRKESVESSIAAINPPAGRYAHDLPRKHGLENRDEQVNCLSGSELVASTDLDPGDKGRSKPSVQELLAEDTAMLMPHQPTDAASQIPVSASQPSKGCSPDCDRSDSLRLDTLGRCTDDLSRSMAKDSLETLSPAHFAGTKELITTPEAVAVNDGDERNPRHLQGTVTSSNGSTDVGLAEMLPMVDILKVKASAKKLQKKSLILNLEGADFDLERKKPPRRPLSPFTSGGALRRILSPVPPSAPPAVTEFGPNISEEIEERASSERSESKMEAGGGERPVRTSRAERGGQMLLSFLAKRMGRAE